MPVGTRATVKGMLPDQLRAIGAQIVLANTYHLFLRPGADVIQAVGGLHAFMNWDRPILTDSGGFQVFSLAGTFKPSDEGVSFRSIVDGVWHSWTPEANVAVQEALGADIIMQLDECPAVSGRESPLVARAVRRSAEWAARAKAAQTRDDQALFGIVQGGVYPDACAQKASSGCAPSGSPATASAATRWASRTTRCSNRSDPSQRRCPTIEPRYLMGVGNPTSMLQAIALGVDMFDCVLPTRTARLGTAFSSRRSDEPAQRAVREGRRAARPRMLLSDVRGVLACLPAAPRDLEGDARRHPALTPQPPLPARPDVRARAASSRGRYARFLASWMGSPAANDY